MIYVIGRAVANWKKHPIKIGYTGGFSADTRLNNIQVGHPHKLRILSTVNGDRDLETIIHTVFKLARSNGEWYHPSKLPNDFLSAIDNHRLLNFLSGYLSSLRYVSGLDYGCEYLMPKNIPALGKVLKDMRNSFKRTVQLDHKYEANRHFSEVKVAVDIHKSVCWKVCWPMGDIMVARDLNGAMALVLAEICKFSYYNLFGFKDPADGTEYSAISLLNEKLTKKYGNIVGFIRHEALTRGYFNCEIIVGSDGNLLPGILVQDYWLDMFTGRLETANIPSEVLYPEASFSIDISVMSLDHYQRNVY